MLEQLVNELKAATRFLQPLDVLGPHDRLVVALSVNAANIAAMRTAANKIVEVAEAAQARVAELEAALAPFTAPRGYAVAPHYSAVCGTCGRSDADEQMAKGDGEFSGWWQSVEDADWSASEADWRKLDDSSWRCFDCECADANREADELEAQGL